MCGGSSHINGKEPRRAYGYNKHMPFRGNNHVLKKLVNYVFLLLNRLRREQGNPSVDQRGLDVVSE